MEKDIKTTYKNIGILVLVSWSIKFLLIPAYYSTDFAVHQNWLRITHEKPLSQWYYNQSQSKWTLDYPPLFAYFQYILSLIANIIDPSIVQTINQFPQTIVFQRVSVIFTDLFYLWTLLKFSNYRIDFKVCLAYLWIPFIMLDNIHFQYNLLMQAILVLSVGFMQNQKYLKSAFCFSLLLNFKHIYLYCAPAFFVYLLKQYVFGDSSKNTQELSINSSRNQGITNSNLRNKQVVSQNFISKFIKVAVITIVPFIISFSPFIIVGGADGVKQIFSRLFPFSRGLVHQYWAPNFWAIYYVLDKLLFVFASMRKQIYPIRTDSNSDISVVNTLKVLPQVPPSLTIALILILLAPIIITYFRSKKKTNFTNLVCLSGFIFFMFGFHVHQKAIVPYINLLFIFVPNTPYLNAANYVSIINLIPLLIQPKQKAFCAFCCIFWMSIWQFMERNRRQTMFQQQQQMIRKLEYKNIIKLVPLWIDYVIQVSGILIILYHLLVNPLLRNPKLEFLPLMMNSVWAAIFNLLWIGYLYIRYICQYGFGYQL